MSQLNYRTINIDQLDPESDAANVASQVRQLLRGGDTEGALRAALDTAPLGGDDRAKEVHMATVTEVLQGIRQADMTRVLESVCGGDGGAERADCLMKYIYKGMSSSGPSGGGQSPRNTISPQSTGGFSQIQARNVGEGGGGQQMSVLLNWHEKLVEVAGTGCIVRVMTDRRTV
ncbi:hypothetical protein N7470_002282 [Penicillium chermesinum]|nr:hypothetical protein N7470_002282 [Penicillium chermesinum]